MPNSPDFDATGLSLPVELTAQDIDMLSTEWESIGEESFINICELQLKFDGTQLSKSIEISRYRALFRNYLTGFLFLQ